MISGNQSAHPYPREQAASDADDGESCEHGRCDECGARYESPTRVSADIEQCVITACRRGFVRPEQTAGMLDEVADA